jgi:hypothetical protein
MTTPIALVAVLLTLNGATPGTVPDFPPPVGAARVATRPSPLREAILRTPPRLQRMPTYSASGPRHSMLYGAVSGALVGFVAGMWLGPKLEGDCRCDDPGMAGFLIGPPVGAVIGGILGAHFLR